MRYKAIAAYDKPFTDNLSHLTHYSELFVSSHWTKAQLAEPFVISTLNNFS